MKEWLRNKLRMWLGVEANQVDIKRNRTAISDLVHIGVDVHFKSPHMILIYSKLNGGQLRHIDADFKDIRDLQRFVAELKHRFKTEHVTWDAPPDLKKFLQTH